MTHVLHRSIAHDYPTAVSGRGIFIRDATGKEYIDASGGAAVSCLGHSHPDSHRGHARAARHSSNTRIPASSPRRPPKNLPTISSPMRRKALATSFFVSGGSEAIEAALKLARQYFVERGEPQRRHLIARRQSYHGITLGALAVGGRARQRKQFAPLLIETHHVSPVYEYRERRADETPKAYGERLAQELEAKIEELGGENVIAFVAETVVGATLGAVPAVPGYFKRVREICDRHGILLILDEVMCGMGRTGTLHACEQEGIAPDIMAIAKGLGGGYAPIGAHAAARQDLQGDRGRLRRLSAQPHLYRPSARLRGGARRAARHPPRRFAWPMSASRARISPAACRSGSAIIPSSATCAAAACFRASSWSPTAAPRNRSIRRASCTRESSAKPWRAA